MNNQFSTLLAHTLDPQLEEEQRRIELAGVEEGVQKFRRLLRKDVSLTLERVVRYSLKLCS